MKESLLVGLTGEGAVIIGEGGGIITGAGNFDKRLLRYPVILKVLSKKPPPFSAVVENPSFSKVCCVRSAVDWFVCDEAV